MCPRDYHPLRFIFPYKIKLQNKYAVIRKLRPITGSLATTKVIFSISFPPATRMFHFAGFAFLLFNKNFCIATEEFPHSESLGS